MANRVLQAKMRTDRQRSLGKRAQGYRSIRITSTEQLKGLRQLGWREVDIYYVTDSISSRLAWFVHPNGMQFLNIL